MAWKRDNLRVSVLSESSIEKPRLDLSLDGEELLFLTPRNSLRKAESMPSESILHAMSTPEVASGGASTVETYFNAMETLPKQKNSKKEVGVRKRNGRRRNSSIDDDSSNGNQVGGEEDTNIYGGQQSLEVRRDARGSRKFLGTTRLPGTDEDNATEDLEFVNSLDGKPFYNVKLGGKGDSGQSSDMVPVSVEMTSNKQGAHESDGLLRANSTEVRDLLAYFGKVGLQRKPDGAGSDLIGNLRPAPIAENVSDNVATLQSPSSGAQARNRWRRVKHILSFAHHVSENVRSASGEFDQGEEKRTAEKLNVEGDAATKPHAAAVEGGKGTSEGQFRAKGRKGMEGMLVKQDRGIMCLVQDFYVACLKMPIGQFLVGVFIAPIALGLLFTPLYVLDMGGLSVDGVNIGEESISVGRLATAKQNLFALMHVFIYSLSLSTTFGGSPVAALSPFCLCVANVHTLMGQFLFVFLSGAVFARMSQPSHPIRCSKTAIIKTDDFNSLQSEEPEEKFKVFAVRLVLTGPPPCELVDAKICLTFRIFIKLPSGSVFCSTQDLNLVRPEVSYLRYGIMVRHVIDKKSPLYEHTMESLMDGDASFSLTIMGLERASMQPIFHLEDYYVCDGDVAWDADYIDFIHVNKDGHRVLDHSRLDLLKVTDNTKMAGCWKRKTQSPKGKKERKSTPTRDDPSSVQGFTVSTPKSTVWTSKSQSFTRASYSTT